MTIPHFLWPKPRIIRALLHATRWTSISQVETLLAEMFPEGFPVLFSSGRAALATSLILSGLNRSDKVGVFPFASHCVLDAVSRIATPAPSCIDVCLNVVFQQWGYVQHRDLSMYDVEDCVDSLLIPAGKLFPGHGAYEIWSFPKILGTSGGGVLWCRSAEVANAICRLRDEHYESSNLLWGLRLLGLHSPLLHTWWQGAEASFGRPSRLQTGEIFVAIDNWNDLVADRQKKLDIVWKLAPYWLEKPLGRLPCVVPVELQEDIDGELLAERVGIASGQRMIERPGLFGSFELTRVLPIPIHQDVTLAQVIEMMDCVEPYVRRQT